MESPGRRLSSLDEMESVGVGGLADEVLFGYSSCKRRTGGSRSALRGPAPEWPLIMPCAARCVLILSRTARTLRLSYGIGQ